jgi:hypothetical protein
MACLLSSLAASADGARADPDKAALGRTVWAAFECAAFAEISGDVRAQVRLYRQGLEAGKAFFQALSAEEITSEELTAYVPANVRFMLASPSADFFAGRVFEAALRSAVQSTAASDQTDHLTAQSTTSTHRRRAQELYEQHDCNSVVP